MPNAGADFKRLKPTEDKRDAIFRATLKLIAEQGFHGTPMSQIAREAGISVGIIYHYFANKTELLNELYRHIKSSCAAVVLRSLREDGPAEDEIKRIFIHIFTYYIEHGDELSFAEQYENSPLIGEATHEQASGLLAPVFRLFQRAQAENRLKPLRTEILIALSFGAVASLAKMYISRGLPPDDAVVQGELNAVWDAIKRAKE